MKKTIDLHFLEEHPGRQTGVTFGIPWKKGELPRCDDFTLADGEGREYPVQSWPLAYWPDGSIKWSGNAAVPACGKGTFHFYRGRSAERGEKLTVTRGNGYLDVDTGAVRCRIGTQGSQLIQSAVSGGKTVCNGGRLVCLGLESRKVPGGRHILEKRYVGSITSAVVEQDGPVRAVIRLEGVHKGEVSGREWLPFRLRLLFFAGAAGFRMVHTFIYNGDKNCDFIKGLGVQFDLPENGPLYNRRVCLGGETGLFYEAAQLLETWRPRIPKETYNDQIGGKLLALTPEKDPEVFSILDKITKWDAYKLIQDSADHYSIRKRTQSECSWITGAQGSRSHGFAFLGGENGGLAVSIRNFWEKSPRSLEISGMTETVARVTAWLWSPDSEPMDLRDYDTQPHANSYYEGFEEMRSTPYGVANTNELSVRCFGGLPDKEILQECAQNADSEPTLVCSPGYYHDSGAFGVWSLPGRGTAAKAAVEDRLDYLLDFYKAEIERRKWYGFWDYGDIMHTYDDARHCWRYDMGGFAWQNTELMPNMWLWYSFLRTGRADVFRMAEAMERHTGEVDVYHIGEYAGLGSRHNVLHWGCGCKEARISMAAHRRFYYYLTADERTGDLMAEVKDADYALLRLDPMRAYYPKDKFPTHARSGPDWSAFCANWMTEWERTGDIRYRDKILKGIECLKKMPHRLVSGTTFGYDPSTGELSFFTEEPGAHLMICQGAPEIWMELNPLIHDPEWENMMAEYGRFYQLPPEERARLTGLDVKKKGFSFPFFAASMTAFAAVHDHDPELAEKVWKILFNEAEKDPALRESTEDVPEAESPVPMKERRGIATNTVAQWSLNAIQCLELIGNELDDKSKQEEE